MTEREDPWRTRLSEYLDGDLEPSERGKLEAHLVVCPSCSMALDGLREVVAHAGDLRAPSEPGEDLWPGIAARLRPRAAAPPLHFVPRLRLARSVGWLAAAAILVLASVATIVWLKQVGPAAPAAQRTAATGGTTVAPGAARPTAVEATRKYDDEVAELRRAVHDRLTHDPQVVEVVERNLSALDQAIAEVEDALAAQPGDAILAKRLAAARQRKLSLLQQTASLAELNAGEAPPEER